MPAKASVGRQVPAAVDIAVIGGGQSALACAFYLQRAGANYLLFDDQEAPGGGWLNSWSSLTLFSTNEFSNLPGLQMPHYEGYPPYTHVIDYLRRIEEHFDIPVLRPAHVDAVTWEPGSGEEPDYFVVRVGDQICRARVVISATGVRSQPYVPYYPGSFAGQQLHGEQYRSPDRFAGARVAVVGGANSGAQIAADLVDHADVTWYTRKAPRWMPDDVDGRVLFQSFDKYRRELADQSTDKQREVPTENPIGDIVMVPPVLAARDSGKLVATPMFGSLDEVEADYLIWCTGYRPALRHLRSVVKHKQPQYPGLYLVGYGNWTGFGSATLAGVGPSARAAVAAARDHIDATASPRR